MFFVLLAHLGAQVTVDMSQYDYERTGANLQEWILHPSNVNSASFGKLFSRSVDASVYALPLIVPNLNIAGERRNVLFVATMGNTVYAFDADDPARAEPYWSKNLGTPAPGDSWIGPVYHGILSTPFIDVPTGTLYTVTMVRKGKESNLFVHALDIHDGKPKYNSPQLLSFPFAGAETLTNVKGGLQRVGLLMRNEVLYIAFANIVPDPKDQHWSQEGFVQSFNARDLSQRLAVFQSTPTGRKGGIWQAGRGIASDGAGNIYIATAGGSYDGITNFGSSVLKFAPRSLKLIDWFTPKNHEFLFLQNIDMSAGGVTLIPNSQLMFAGGKEGVIFLLNREAMGKLEGENAEPLQRFKATNGCGQKDCAQTLGTAFWARKNDGVLYVWDRNDVLNAYDFVNERFVTTPSAVSKEKPGMNGGPTVSANGSDAGTGIVWAATTQSTKSGGLAPGTLRAFLASNIGQELYNSDQERRARRARRFHKVCTTGGSEWKSIRADAVEGGSCLRAPLWQGRVAAGTGANRKAERRRESDLRSADHGQEHFDTRDRRAIRDCRGQLDLGRYSDQRDRCDILCGTCGKPRSERRRGLRSGCFPEPASRRRSG